MVRRITEGGSSCVQVEVVPAGEIREQVPIPRFRERDPLLRQDPADRPPIAQDGEVRVLVARHDIDGIAGSRRLGTDCRRAMTRGWPATWASGRVGGAGQDARMTGGKDAFLELLERSAAELYADPRH